MDLRRQKIWSSWIQCNLCDAVVAIVSETYIFAFIKSFPGVSSDVDSGTPENREVRTGDLNPYSGRTQRLFIFRPTASGWGAEPAPNPGRSCHRFPTMPSVLGGLAPPPLLPAHLPRRQRPPRFRPTAQTCPPLRAVPSVPPVSMGPSSSASGPTRPVSTPSPRRSLFQMGPRAE